MKYSLRYVGLGKLVCGVCIFLVNIERKKLIFVISEKIVFDCGKRYRKIGSSPSEEDVEFYGE